MWRDAEGSDGRRALPRLRVRLRELYHGSSQRSVRFRYGEPEDVADFQATTHEGDDRALAHAEQLLRRHPELRVVEVWEGQLKLARLDQEARRPSLLSLRELLAL